MNETNARLQVRREIDYMQASSSKRSNRNSQQDLIEKKRDIRTLCSVHHRNFPTKRERINQTSLLEMHDIIQKAAQVVHQLIAISQFIPHFEIMHAIRAPSQLDILRKLQADSIAALTMSSQRSPETPATTVPASEEKSRSW